MRVAAPSGTQRGAGGDDEFSIYLDKSGQMEYKRYILIVRVETAAEAPHSGRT